jgi:hypothetical protein
MRICLYISCYAVLFTLALPCLVAAQGAGSSITRESLAGVYDGGQMEVGARLLLKANGHFSYELAYGALDEVADGTWDLKGGAVFLTTVPAVVAPRFVVVNDEPAPRGELWIQLASGPVMEGAPQRVYLIYGPNQPPEMIEVAANGHVPLPGNRWPKAIVPEIPVYPVQSKAIPLTSTAGHRFLLRFEPNGIGKADFRAQRLDVDGGVLIMSRHDLELMLRFKRQDSHSER